MRRSALAALLLATAACNQAPSAGNDTTATADSYDLAAQKAKLAVIDMKPDTSFLNAEERQVVNLLILASEQMSLIYRAQRDANWKGTRAAIEKDSDKLKLEMFDRYYGPWDDLADNRPFFGDAKMPEGAGFYPTDLTKEAFDAYLVANPSEKASLTSPYTIVVRDGAKLKAIPYSVAFKTELTEAARLLNEAAAINPINLVALALLSTSKLALDDKALARVLDLYLALLRSVPYSPHTTLPEGDGQALIDYAKGMDLLAEQKDALGKIHYLDENNAVLMTYYRNNVLHIFALPALLASFFQSSARISREQILRYTRALYPYLQSELFIRWSMDELDAVIDQWLQAFVEQGLLRFENDVYLRPAPSSRHFVLLTLLSKSIAQTLQRFYMTVSLLLNPGTSLAEATSRRARSSQYAAQGSRAWPRA